MALISREPSSAIRAGIETGTTRSQVLDIDVQLMILDVLSQMSPRSLLSVALSSRSLYHLSKSLIYRVLRFTFNRSRRDVNGRLIRRLLADDSLSPKVQEIRVLWGPSAKLQPGEGSKGDLELLGQALPNLTELKTFIWDAQYPILSWLLEALHTHRPHCLLYTRHPASQASAQTLPRLYASPSLVSLDATITAGQFLAFRELQRVLASTPNLRDLSIASALNSPSPQVSVYQEQEEPKLLHLRSLELYGCIFGVFKLPIAWSMLERLSLDSLSYLPNSEPDFAGLKSLRLRTTSHSNLVPLVAALQDCKKLESLDLTGLTGIIHIANDDFWGNLGRTLTRLRLHEEEKRDAVSARHPLSVTDVGRIAKYCPKLRSLGLDLACSGQEWPHLMLRHIAHDFWFLVHLELNILIENPQHDHPTSPKATQESVPEVWQYLWQQIHISRVQEGHAITKPRIRSFDLIVGSKRPVLDSSPAQWQTEQQRFTFDISDRDDEARLGVAKVSCTAVEALLSKLSLADPLWTHQQELIIKIANERARKGPHIKMPSVMDDEMVRPSPFWDRLDEERFYYR